MNCSEVANILNQEQLAALPAARRNAVLAHAGCCPDCGAAVTAHEMLHADLVPDAPADLRPKLMAAIPDQPIRPEQRSVRRVAAVTAGAFALGGAVFAALILSDGIGDEDLIEATESETVLTAQPDGTVPGGDYEAAVIEYLDAVEAEEQQAPDTPRAIVEEYRAVMRQVDGLIWYNTMLERQIAIQEEQIAIQEDVLQRRADPGIVTDNAEEVRRIQEFERAQDDQRRLLNEGRADIVREEARATRLEATFEENESLLDRVTEQE